MTLNELAQKLTLLIISEDVSNCELINIQLQPYGFKTLCSQNIHDGFQIIQNQKVDAILTDIHMTQGSGLELLDQIHLIPQPRPRVLLMSTQAIISNYEATRRGASALFRKPFSIEILVHYLYSLISETDLSYTRSVVRFNTHIPCSLAVPEFDEISTRLTNISERGCFIALKDHLPHPGEEIKLILKPSEIGSLHINTQAICHWIRSESSIRTPSGFGASFKVFDPVSERYFKQLIYNHKKNAYIVGKT